MWIAVEAFVVRFALVFELFAAAACSLAVAHAFRWLESITEDDVLERATELAELTCTPALVQQAPANDTDLTVEASGLRAAKIREAA